MLAKVGNAYLRERVARGEMTRTSAANTRYTLSQFAESYGNRPIDKLGPRAVERFFELHPEWKQSTRVSTFGRLRPFLVWLRVRGYITADPLAGVSVPKRPRPAPRPLARHQYEDLLLVLPDARARLIVALMYWLGLRRSSVSWLNIEDVDWHTKTIHVRLKGGAEQRLPLVPQVEVALNAYLRAFPASSGPLIRRYDQPWERLTGYTIGTLFTRWAREAGIKTRPFDGVSAHACRHAAATELAEATGDVFLVQELLGHASAATSAWYVKSASTSRLRDALDLRDPAPPAAVQ